MNLSEAASLARTLMNQHGFGHVPFEFDRAKRRIGAAHWFGGQPKKLTLSRPYVELLPEHEVRDTILHEIAHFLAGPKHGHDVVWRIAARNIGANPKRCKATETKPEASVRGICPNGHRTEAHRLPLRVKSCGKCSPVHSLDYLYRWTKNGTAVPLSQMPSRYQAEYNRIVK